MRRAAYGKAKKSLLGLLSKFIIFVGIMALIAPYALHYWNYQTSVVLALEKEDQLGEQTNPYEQVDYSKLSIAAPCVYTAEEIEAAQRGSSLLDDFSGLDEGYEPRDSAEDTSTSKQTLEVKKGSYLLEIPAIDLRSSIIKFAIL